MKQIELISPNRSEETQPLQHMVAIVLATIFLIFWVFFAYSATVSEPLSVNSLQLFGVNAYLFGVAIAELAFPTFLLLIVSRSNLFGRIINKTDSGTDAMRLTAILIAIQLLFLFYQFGLRSLTNVSVTFGYFIVIVAAILGGWRVGLLVGLATTVGVGSFEYATWDWIESFELAEFLNYAILANIPAMGALWLGYVAGHTSELLSLDLQYNSSRIAALSVLALCAISVGVFFSAQDTSYYFEGLLPRLLLVALSLVLFVSMARDVLNEASRREAEATALTLAQTQLDLAQTQLALAEAELRALHAQINPHFFFNALNTIRYFIRTEPAEARDLLTKLSEIFQRVLNAGEYVSVQEEMRHVEAYLSLEKARLDERLQIIWTDMIRDSSNHQIPTLILQPLVENAVIHGINPKPDGGTVHIVINQVGNELLLQVDDDGVGFNVEEQNAAASQTGGAVTSAEPETSARPSLGIKNVDGRLRKIYGEEYGLIVESKLGKGTRILVRIPIAQGIHSTNASEAN